MEIKPKIPCDVKLSELDILIGVCIPFFSLSHIIPCIRRYSCVRNLLMVTWLLQVEIPLDKRAMAHVYPFQPVWMTLQVRGMFMAVVKVRAQARRTIRSHLNTVAQDAISSHLCTIYCCRLYNNDTL